MAMASMFQGMQSSATGLFSAYASFAGTMMLIRSMANDVIPQWLRAYVVTLFQGYFTPPPSILTLIIEPDCGCSTNQVFEAAEIYLPTKISPSNQRLKVSKLTRHKTFTVSIEKGEKIHDVYDGVDITWKYCVSETEGRRSEKEYYEITFEKKYKDKVLSCYLPFVLSESQEIEDQSKVVKLYSKDIYSRSYSSWGSINLEHPSTFDKLAMDPDLKTKIIEDLERFLRRKEFYQRVGKAWKRGYLLYGPPGTGKSSLIACMANYLKFDIYDVELTSVYSNADLKRILLSTSNRSILVIEDIDCSSEVRDREQDTDNTSDDDSDDSAPSAPPKLTLSGLLNFMDGLWSSCGDERIFIFTTNHKDRIDPALLRPGRMDMHILLSYITPHGFRILASNYLELKGEHELFEEIEGLIRTTNITPAEVAEQLMTSDDPDVALGALVDFIKRKKIEEIKRAADETEQKSNDNEKKGSREIEPTN